MAEEKRKVELILDEATQKEFERLKYALGVTSDIQLCQQSFDYVLTLLHLVEQGYNVFVPGKFLDDKTIQVMQGSNKGVSYIMIPADVGERLCYWTQLQRVYEDAQDRKKPENS